MGAEIDCRQWRGNSVPSPARSHNVAGTVAQPPPDREQLFPIPIPPITGGAAGEGWAVALALPGMCRCQREWRDEAPDGAERRRPVPVSGMPATKSTVDRQTALLSPPTRSDRVPLLVHPMARASGSKWRRKPPAGDRGVGAAMRAEAMTAGLASYPSGAGYVAQVLRQSSIASSCEWGGCGSTQTEGAIHVSFSIFSAHAKGIKQKSVGRWYAGDDVSICANDHRDYTKPNTCVHTHFPKSF
jgi:hypothetical protein